MGKDLGLPTCVFIWIASHLTHRLSPTPVFLLKNISQTSFSLLAFLIIFVVGVSDYFLHPS